MALIMISAIQQQVELATPVRGGGCPAMIGAADRQEG
jgi:hypothetical protein